MKKGGKTEYTEKSNYKAFISVPKTRYIGNSAF